jgi:hypothetical protein
MGLPAFQEVKSLYGVKLRSRVLVKEMIEMSRLKIKLWQSVPEEAKRSDE